MNFTFVLVWIRFQQSTEKRHFYGTENVIWADFWPVGKKIGPIMSNFWGRFFHVFMDKKKCLKFFWKHCSICTEKLHNISLFFHFLFIFLPQNRLNIHNQLCITLLELLFCPHENQAQKMGWHGWDWIYIISMVSSRFFAMRNNQLNIVKSYLF